MPHSPSPPAAQSSFQQTVGQRTPRAHQQKIRVCHIVATTDSVAWPVDQLTRLRDQYGYDVSAVLSGTDGPLVDRLRAAGIPCHAVDLTFSAVPSFALFIAKSVQLAWLLRRERFDVVQTALWQAMLLGRFAAWLADVPVRLTMVAGPFHLEAPISRWIDGDTAWMESMLVGCCRSIVETYRELGVKDNRLALVYYGPDETRFDPATTVQSRIREEYGWPADTPLVVHVAWFYQRLQDNRWMPPLAGGNGFKGHEELIRATPYILREFPNAKVLLVGQGWLGSGRAFLEEMRALVSGLGLEESVIFTGFRPTIDDVLAAADVAVQPSLTEGCGGTFEALLMERPTVGTRTGGIPDMVIDGETGVLVNPADPEDLARGICELLRDPERARALGRAGRQHVLGTATLSRTVADLDRLYRRGLFRGGKRRSGFQWWVTALRLPLLACTALQLNLRLVLVEYYYVPRWERGWRPWQLRALICLPVEIVGLTLLSLAPRVALTAAYRLSARVWPRLRGIAGRDEVRTSQGAGRRSATSSAVGA
jgi:glycosyltransferase involved in cell wall biosynthesis